jgi:nickel-dependent lactate racemase
MKTELHFGGQKFALQLPSDRHVSIKQPATTNAPRDLSRLLSERLNHPTAYPALKLALTPDDHIAIVLDPGLPQLESLLSGVMAHLAEGHIQPENVTLVVAYEPADPAWRERLGEWQSKLKIEIHDPTDRDKVSYLAATQKGRRVYINRTVVDADQSVVLARLGFDWTLGYTGSSTAIYPALSDEATRQEFGALTDALIKDDGASAHQQDIEEAIWLLGAPFFIQVIEGAGDEVAEIVTGAAESREEARRQLNTLWKMSGKARGAVVIAEVTDSPNRLELRDLAAAASTAARLVEPDGSLVIVFPGKIELDEAMQVVGSAGDAYEAVRTMHRNKPQNPGNALQWLAAVGRVHVYLLSNLASEKVEEILATPLEKLEQIQKLVDSASSTLIIRDPQKIVVDPATTTGETSSPRSTSRREGRARR